jgi:hypothetical protein
VGTHDITKIFQPRDKSTGSGGGVPAIFCAMADIVSTSCEIEISQEEELREGDVSGASSFEG